MLAEPLVSDIKEMCLAIVRFGPPTEIDGLRPGQYFQVTINPYLFSPCGRFIRFGESRGDELIGWQRADCLFVVSVIQKIPAGISLEKLELNYCPSPALE